MVSQGTENGNARNLFKSNQYNIRQDSFVELPIIGEVNIVGKTIIEAERFLEKICNFYVDPFINLVIDSRRVFIFAGSGGSAK